MAAMVYQTPEWVTAAGPASDGTFFGMLDHSTGEMLIAAARAVVFSPGAVVLHEGYGVSHAVILTSGWAKAHTVLPGGDTLMLRLYGPGDIAGSECALTGLPPGESVTALTQTRALLLPAARFTALLHEHPAVARTLVIALHHRVRQADQRVRAQARKDPARQLAALLLGLADRCGTATGEQAVTITVPLSQEELASWAGCSRRTAARTLGKLRNDGVITIAYRHITIINPQVLQRLATGRGTW
jgi:CRP/FNR family cyclic AMP-dependent transcriptional regulator